MTETQVEVREEKRKMTPREIALRVFGILFAVGLTVAIFAFRDRLKDAAGYGYLGIFLISLLGNATIVLPVPTIVTAFAGGSIYPPILVGVVSAAGATIGELTGYIAGRSGQAVVENRATYEKFTGWMARYGLWALFFLAVIPNPLFDVAGIVAGFSKMKVWKYLAVTWAGKTVKFLGIAYLGAGASGLLDKLGF